MDRLTRKAIGLVPVALLVALAVGAPAALAKLPEYGKCVATESGKGGKYSDSACVVKAHRKHGEFPGAYEWQPLTRSFSLKPIELQGPIAFETASGDRIECATSAEFDSGRLSGIRTAKTPLWAFEGCESGGQECHSAVSPEEGEITNEVSWLEEAEEEEQPIPGWVGELGFVSKGASPVVGMAYTIKNHERAYPPISCAGAEGTVWIGGDPKGNDEIVSTVGPVNQMTMSFTESLAESAPGIASPAGLAHHRPASLMAFRENKWEPVAIVGTMQESLGGRELEIKATP